MKFNGNFMMFDDEFELNWEFINELGLDVDNNGFIIDVMTNTRFRFNGLDIIANINPNDIKYPGTEQINLDLLHNIKLVGTLFAYYLKRKEAEGMPILSYFDDRQIQPNGLTYWAVTVKFDPTHSITSKYYYNRCLRYLDLIFTMEGDDVDLSNFDVLIEQDLKKKR